jgi:hypothetical protein
MTAVKVVLKSYVAVSHVNIEKISDALKPFHRHHEGSVTFHISMTDSQEDFVVYFRWNVRVLLTEYPMICSDAHKLEQQFIQCLNLALWCWVTENTYFDKELSAIGTVVVKEFSLLGCNVK